MERYKKEIERVYGVLDGVLSKQEWLVAGKPTVADLAFLQYVLSCTECESRMALTWNAIGGLQGHTRSSRATTTRRNSLLSMRKSHDRLV